MHHNHNAYNTQAVGPGRQVQARLLLTHDQKSDSRDIPQQLKVLGQGLQVVGHDKYEIGIIWITHHDQGQQDARLKRGLV